VPRGKAHRDQGYRLVIGFEPRKVSLEKAHRELSHRLEIELRRGGEGKRKERKKKIKFPKNFSKGNPPPPGNRRRGSPGTARP
jgi:hypothetical protein